MALRAAAACVVFSGRPKRAGELRDAIHILRPGDLPGQAGEICLEWRRTSERPVSVQPLTRALLGSEPDQIAIWRDAGRGTPVTRDAMVLETLLSDASRAIAPGLILANAALAQALGWTHVDPMLTAGLTR